jgi:hypothetical protein
MATKTWVGGNAGDPNSWNETLNWSGGTPVNGDDIVINFVANEPVLNVSTAALKSVTINASASLTVGTFTLNATGSGGLSLAGSGATITVAGGTINATGAGVVLASGSVLSGFGAVTAHTTYSGTGTITASGGTLVVGGGIANTVIMTIDSGSVSDLNILNTATAGTAIAISSANQTLEIGASGALTITPAESITNGTIKIDGNNARLTDAAGLTIGSGASLIGSGLISVGSGSSNLLSGSGIVEASGGTLNLQNNIGSTSLQFEIANSATSILRLGGTVGNLNTFDFLGSAGELSLASAATFNDTVNGLNVGADLTPTDFIDILAIPGVTVAAGGTGSGTSGTVTLSDGAVLHLGGITNSSGTWYVDTKSDGAGGTDVFLSAVCFAAGTHVLTIGGEKRVENLMPGDVVCTMSGDEPGARPVRWVGRRRIALASHPRPETVAPVRIQCGAFADKIPHRDLLVSPDHAIFVDGALICARQLINGTTIRQEMDWRSVSYFHVELDAHAILLAEGLPAESYLDTGNRGFFTNADRPLVLHGDATGGADHAMRAAMSCAPFASDEASVRPIWQRLADRAAVLGLPVEQPGTATEPELRIVVAGRTVWPMHVGDGRHVFLLPRG